MEGVCALRADMLCDRGQGSCSLQGVMGSGPSAGLWQHSGLQAGALEGPTGNLGTKASPRDMRMAEDEVVSEDRGAQPWSPYPPLPPVTDTYGHAVLKHQELEGTPSSCSQSH